MKKLTQNQEAERLGADYAEYQAESKRMADDGKAIGTFIRWLHDNRPSIKIPMSREDYYGK